MVLTMEEAIPCRVWLRDHALTEESPLTGRRGMVTGERPSRTAVSLRVCPCESPAPAKAASRRSESPNLSRMSIPARSATSPMPARRRRLRKGPARNLGADQQSTSLLLSISPSHYSGARPLLLDFFSLRPRPTRFFTPRIRRWLQKTLASYGTPWQQRLLLFFPSPRTVAIRGTHRGCSCCRAPIP